MAQLKDDSAGLAEPVLLHRSARQHAAKGGVRFSDDPFVALVERQPDEGGSSVQDDVTVS
jgi:hypothetical protein